MYRFLEVPKHADIKEEILERAITKCDYQLSKRTGKNDAEFPILL